MDYTILIHQAEEGGFWSEVPALPGCFSQGETIDETLLNTKEAVRGLSAGLERRSDYSSGRGEPFHWQGSRGSCGPLTCEMFAL